MDKSHKEKRLGYQKFCTEDILYICIIYRSPNHVFMGNSFYIHIEEFDEEMIVHMAKVWVKLPRDQVRICLLVVLIVNQMLCVK